MTRRGAVEVPAGDGRNCYRIAGSVRVAISSGDVAHTIGTAWGGTTRELPEQVVQYRTTCGRVWSETTPTGSYDRMPAVPIRILDLTVVRICARCWPHG